MQVISELRPLPMREENNDGNNRGNNADQNGSTQNGAIQTEHYWIPANCSQVTEIIIRVGPPAAVQTLGGPPCVPCLPCCPPSLTPSLDSQSKKLFQRIQKLTKDTPEELMRKLARETAVEELSQEIRRLARRLGII